MSAPARQRTLHRLEWRVSRAVHGALAGDYRSAFRGRGREFDQVVPYAWGDDIRDIDWNVTARRGEPYRKSYVEERELTVVLLFEDALSLGFGSGTCTKRDVLLEVAGLFAVLSAANRDRAAAWHATPRRHWIRRPVRGRARVLGVAAGLLGREAPAAADGGDVVVPWRRVLHAFPRHSVVIWLGDFPPRPRPELWTSLCRRYEMVGVRVEDPWERALPAVGRLSALDPAPGRVLPFEPGAAATRRLHAAWVAERERAFGELFPARRDGLRVSTEDDPLDAVVRFLRRRGGRS